MQLFGGYGLLQYVRLSQDVTVNGTDPELLVCVRFVAPSGGNCVSYTIPLVSHSKGTLEEAL